ncbi:MAG: hypothetical protein M3301_00325 [Chloroflexota bacterium]|nr:hypothetical protein [Chloroflexota bacterium]
MPDGAARLDRGRGPDGPQPTVHRFRVQAKDRAQAVVAARDQAWEQGLRVLGDAQVSLVRSRPDGHEFLVLLPCLEQE